MTLPVGVHGTFKSKATSPYKEGDRAIIECEPGYASNIVISNFVMKNGKLQWDPPSIECIPKSCGPPPFIHNGKIIGNLFTFPHSFSYECNPGYKLNGSSKYYCSPTGKWIPEIKNVSCSLVKCPELKNPKNGTVSYIDRVYESIATYKCNAGYKLVGKATRMCTENGTWSEQEPKCEDIVFKLPPQPPLVLNPKPSSPTAANLPPVLNSKPQSPTVTNVPPIFNPQPPPPVALNPKPPVLNPQPSPPIIPNLPPVALNPPKPSIPNSQPLLQSKNIMIVICILLIVLTILFNIKNRQQ